MLHVAQQQGSDQRRRCRRRGSKSVHALRACTRLTACLSALIPHSPPAVDRHRFNRLSALQRTQPPICGHSSPPAAVVRQRHVSCRAAESQTNAVDVGGGAGGGGGTGENGTGGNGAGGDGGGGGKGDDGDNDRIIGLEEAIALATAAKAELPREFVAIAAATGIRLSVVESFLALQTTFLAGWLARTLPWFRDRLLLDHRFLFKVLAEVLIDSGCATIAEVQKRGDEFWDEFEFYLSDLLVGLVLDVVLVGLLAPTAVLGKARPKPPSGVGQLLARVPAAAFQANVPGSPPYGLGSRAACIGVKFLEYSLAGMACGLVGQGIANAAMIAKRKLRPGDDYTIAPPNLVHTALTWGLFMGVSSNLRYQVVVGLERLVDVTIAKKVPQIAYGTSFGIRFVNNVIGGMQYIDLARWTGVQ